MGCREDSQEGPMPACSRLSRTMASRGEADEGAQAARVCSGELDNPDGSLEGFGSHELAVDNSSMHTLGVSCKNNKNHSLLLENVR